MYPGVEDNGYPKGLEPHDLEGSIATLHNMAASLGATATLLQYIPGAWGRRAALLRVGFGARKVSVCATLLLWCLFDTGVCLILVSLPVCDCFKVES